MIELLQGIKDFAICIKSIVEVMVQNVWDREIQWWKLCLLLSDFGQIFRAHRSVDMLIESIRIRIAKWKKMNNLKILALCR